LNIDVISLQKGFQSEIELELLKNNLWPGARITSFSKELVCFTGTATLIKNLGLIIAVDTSVAHLAWALGKMYGYYIALILVGDG
jgi:hypothetical protein